MTLHELIDSLFLTLDAEKKRSEDIEKRSISLDEYDMKLRDREKELDKKNFNLIEREDALSEEKKFLAKIRAEQSIKEKDIERQYRELSKATEILPVIEERKKEISQMEDKLKLKLAKDKEIDGKISDLETREAKLKAEIDINRKRTEDIAIQLDSITKERDRLQRIASSMGV